MKRILIIDDDARFGETLAAAFTRKDMEAAHAPDGETALAQATTFRPEGIVLDLTLGKASGLALLPALRALLPQARIVVLTGYANITTAVEAIKLGAVHYLAKPVGLAEILAAFAREAGDPALPLTPHISAAREVQWEHIHRVLHLHQGNISAAARALKMHRRTLQRKLEKNPK